MKLGVVVAGAALLAAGCAPRRARAPLGEMPVVRVGIVVDRDAASLGATGQFRVLGADGAILGVVDGGRVWRVERAPGSDRILVRRPDRAEPAVVPGPLGVRTERPGDWVLIDGRRYRGEALVAPGSTGITVVNRVPLEWYVQSVVGAELGFRAAADRQAVMAQAVATRTYALRYRGRREALGFDLYATVADQVYGGAEAEGPEVADATQRTAGQILRYRGEPIQALFFSTCGWSTEAAHEVFRNVEAVPYLRAVSDRFGRGREDYYCAISPRFRWREEWDGAGLNAMLTLTLPGIVGPSANHMGRVTNLRVSRTTPTGRVAELVVETTNGDFVVPQHRVREALRPAGEPELPSTLLQLHVERRGGELVRVAAAGAGFGHGVGMCQFGAVGRARAGHDYRRILAAYYPGAKLERAY